MEKVENVSRLDDHRKAERPSIAVPTQIVMNLDDRRQINFQVGFDLDESDAEISARLDRVFAIADRQKARYELPTILEEIELHQRKLDQFRDDLKAVEARFRSELARFDVQISETMAAKDEIREGAFKVHTEAGRKGSFELRGADKSNSARCDMQVEQIKADKLKQENERHVAVEQLEKSVLRFEEEIALRRTKADHLSKLIGTGEA